jgi:hypothetical protein
MSDTKEKIIQIADSVKNLLIAKNEAYGDSALKPAKIFARGSAIDNLCSRIDDKLMRIKNGGINELTEDTITDLIGYLILLKIAIADEQEGSNCNDLRDTIQESGTALHPNWESTRTDSVG